MSTKTNTSKKTTPIAATTTGAAPSVLEDSGSRWVGLLLGLMMVMAPAMGVPSEEMLQDTLKSAIIALFSLSAGLLFFWRHYGKPTMLIWHGLVWLPLALAGYALISMAWSHAYLAGVEAMRWFLFSLIMWLCLNTRLTDLEMRLPWGIHVGVTLASVWTVLQFLVDFNLFPQGPNPASTFVNRNFFAELSIAGLPYSVYLLLKTQGNRRAFALAASIGLNLAALMMTGTRSALIALLMLAPLLSLLYLRNRKQLEAFAWNRRKIIMVWATVMGTTLGLGSIPTGNPKLISEFGPVNALVRATGRTMSVMQADEYTTGSFSIRSVMWLATGRMIAANPMTGVGAGAWEVQAPLYQRAGTQLETDFYAHNEFLQLLAEYGVVGWVFLGLLFSYLAYSARTTWTSTRDPNQGRTLLRATALTSILMLLIVSNAGFPWRLASTSALFALSLGLLAGSDASLGLRGKLLSSQFMLNASAMKLALAIGVACMMLAIYITQRAAYCERNLVRGIKLALTISNSGQPNNPYWNSTKEEVLTLMRNGIDLNRHYRKLTPMAADEMASWGDWRNALWIWESVLESRPNVVAIIANISKSYLQAGNLQQAQKLLERAKRLQATAPAVRILNVMILERTGQEQQAAEEIRLLFKDGVIDYDTVYAAYLLGARISDWGLMIQALELRIDKWPMEAADGWLKLGQIYSEKIKPENHEKALQAFRAAVNASHEHARESVLEKIPPRYKQNASIDKD